MSDTPPEIIELRNEAGDFGAANMVYIGGRRAGRDTEHPDRREAMSSQLQDYFEEAVETVARLLYARRRTPREPEWMDLEPRMKEGEIRDARVVIDLWLKVSSPCLWCHGTGRTADHHPCEVCGGVGFQRFNGPEAKDA